MRWQLVGPLLFACAALTSGGSALGAEELRPYHFLIERVAESHDLDPKLFGALVDAESGRRADAVSPKGARGLAQLMPSTAERFGVSDIHDPEDNLTGAARYLRWLIDRYSGDLRRAVAAYNAGEGAVDRARGVPNYPETKAFVERVLRRAGLDGAAARREAQRRETREPRVRLVRRPDGSVLITNR